MLIPVGSPAPDFTLQDETGEKVTLSQLQGKPVILYFYPKDDTPGCTTEACNFRDDYTDFEKAGVRIIGVSPDTPESHMKFKRKYDLPFPLLSDPDHKVCDLYGVWGPKKFMGKSYEGVLRTTYLISSNGTILHVFENVKPADHSKQILSLLDEIGQQA
jgi:peroxiredoxin Q/BCP